MDCRDYEALINMHIDGMLPEQHCQALSDHLLVCPDCAALLADYQRLDDLLRQQMPLVAPPPDLVASVMSALPDSPPQPQMLTRDDKLRLRRRRRWLAGVAVAAALVAGCVLGSMMEWGLPGVEAPVAENDPIAPENDPAQPDQPGLIIAEDDPRLPEPGAENDPVDPDPVDPAPVDPEDPTDPDPGLPADPPAEQDPPPENDPIFHEAFDLPGVAYGGASHGTYSLTTLAAVEGYDAVAPRLSGDTVTFYTQVEGVYLEWQVDVSAANAPICVGETESLPSPQGLGRYNNDDNSYTSYNGSILAINSPDGLYLHEDGAAESALVADAAGGRLAAWSPDGNKVLYSDGGDNLYVYYLVEDISLSVHNTPVGSACWSPDGRTIVFSAFNLDTGFYSVYRVSMP